MFRMPKFCPFPPELLCDGEAIGGGGVGSGGGWNNDETFGVFGVLTLTGPFEFKLGDGLGTGIVPMSLDVGVGGNMLLFILLLFCIMVLLLKTFWFC